MATRNMSYDNAAYQAVLLVGLGTMSGANANSQRFAAPVQCLIKSVEISVNTAGTSAAQVINLLTQSGTTTTTTALTTYGSAQAKAGTNVTTTLTLAAGDQAWLVAGTDATNVFGAGMELALPPGGSVTV